MAMSKHTEEQPWERHRFSAGCRRGLICYKKKEDLPALKVPHPPTQQCPMVLRYAQGRCRSAMENRRDHESSNFFKREPEPGWLTSNYAIEYCPKKLSSITKSLPPSPTTMNNPHPNKEFIRWRLPGRTQHQNAISPNPLTWHFINESIYGDCRNTTNGHMQFPDEKLEQIMNELECKTDKAECDAIARFPFSQESVLVSQIVKSQYVPVLKEWLKGADEKERDVFISFLKEGQDKKGDQKRLEEVVKDVLQPGSEERLKKWLEEITPGEKRVVLKVLESLKKSIAGHERKNYRSRVCSPGLLHRRTQQQRAYNQSSHAVPDTHSGAAACSNSTRPLGCCDVPKRKVITTGFVRDGHPQFDFLPNAFKIPRPESHIDENPPLWHNRIMRDGHLPTYPQPGGMFHCPHRNMGQHFTIIPEWPTA